jgi:predicted phosphodiesterase
MRLAVISDIHGNLEALERVFSDIELSDADGIVCLGDMIGYGPDPEAVVDMIRARNILTLMGNHELAVSDPGFLKFFNPLARKSLEKTVPLLSDGTIRYVRRLEHFRIAHSCRFVHGFPPDSPRTYLVQVSHRKLEAVFDRIGERLCFVGHTHIPAIIEFDGGAVTEQRLKQGRFDLDKKRKYIINVGSVGQPRDGDSHAKYAIWDSEKYQLELRYVSYDIWAVAEKITALGFPEAHARRLW